MPVHLSDPIPAPPRTQARDCTTFCPPPLDGSLTLLELYDWHRERSPDHRLFVYPRKDGTVCSLNWRAVVDAMYHGAKLIKERLSGVDSNDSVPVVAIVSQSETIGYMVSHLSIMRANFIPFPISPRSSPLGVAHLLSRAGICHVLVGRDRAMRELVEEAFKILKSQSDLPVLPGISPMFLFDELFHPSSPGSNILGPIERRAPEDVLYYLHSSGSTSDLPKIIPVNNRSAIQLCTFPCYGERDFTNSIASIHSAPMFHGFGLQAIPISASTGSVLGCFEPESPPVFPTSEGVLESSKVLDCDYIWATPKFIEEWSLNPECMKWLKGGLVFSGGALNKEAGDRLASVGVSLFTEYGATEVGCLNVFVPESISPKDWEYFTFSQLPDIKLVPQGDAEGTFEVVVVPSPTLIPHLTNTTIDGVEAYATSDLVVSHPTKPGMWKVFGRRDDQIVHSSGEKTNPCPLESILQQDPSIRSAIMFGSGQFQVGVLLEPIEDRMPKDSNETERFFEDIGPTLEKRKGLRQLTLSEYSEEISELYSAVADSMQAGISAPSSWDESSAKSFVRDVVKNVLKKDINDADDLFENGCDRYLPRSRNFVYNYPNINSLTDFILEVVGDGISDTADPRGNEQAMLRLVEKYTMDTQIVPGADRPSRDGKCVLLTGSTGSFGTYLLADLISDASISRIYALNRAKSNESLEGRQRKAFMERGIDEKLLKSGKLRLIEGNLLVPEFGIPPELYKEMEDSVTHVIHNAWPVNFNLQLSSFEPNLRGVRNLLDFSVRSGAHFTFIGSVGVLQNAPLDLNHQLKEEFIPAGFAIGSGYAESKWVAEQLVLESRRRAGLKGQIIRAGQLCGSRANGSWNRQEWAPAMIQSAKWLGCLPSDEGAISWIPVDTASRAVVDSLNSDAQDPILHLRHPQPTTWRVLARYIASDLGVDLVPLKAWLECLENAVREDAKTSERHYASFLLPFYRNMKESSEWREAFGLPVLDIEKALKNCSSLVDPAVEELGEKDVHRWLEYWKGNEAS
ncbi:hypothetical protein V5O48_007572 [Marasmius crinis-equi]|uniref:Acetyl-CoA synthetase-like protein n=1 Tax=Marasmius crinis-equi TaxID=585013 RepID=A0ABR3FGQ9_9AGAR